jgi:hypothetical protein
MALQTQKIPAYGRDVLRLWVGTVDYWQDISIGPTVLAQTAEALRKIRNTVRFALGNLGTEEERTQFTPVARSDMRLVRNLIWYSNCPIPYLFLLYHRWTDMSCTSCISWNLQLCKRMRRTTFPEVSLFYEAECG